MATTNGSTAIRDKILASLARYRALRIGKFPCAFWRLSARPGLTAMEIFEWCYLQVGHRLLCLGTSSFNGNTDDVYSKPLLNSP
ncbi:hypothetical protein [Bathymodiolus japonicus methanotrophic gill symbiont]|uniref:hypothetical protein n=1 Tax=Bathymodiolus japonicus methanotrophic gill symbiont TaxID=113269 RepID=UPI001C8E7B8B|nr:hypothetical protein [Bathymodiolus japonicus methanotrophic gill symbiont]